MTSVTALTEDSFDTALNASTTPMLVEFWAEGCGPCLTLAALLDDLATETAGRLRIAKVRLDDNPGLSSRYEIMALPTLLLFNNGQVPQRLPEIRTRQELHKHLAAYLPHYEDQGLG